ncbi:SRPBCC domain-containing protein [Yinghuangia soli]|uniref:SRPBCC domain-containing protein n=1 Tax=Yinghuangia soli TaxID=2908204 RepID=A0AA41Q8Y0_9ACTN|nr:SRPBCC domain-containing protein [Yinghuangia soli]MCF2533090.1 SRPBCC domain-containing protein [Yinghuangia soli]
MRKIETQVVIEAAPEQVWAVLTDFARFGEWNPFIREAEGEVRVGARLRLKMFPANGKPMVFKPRVLVAEPGVELRWIGRLFVRGIFDGEHYFRLVEIPGADGPHTRVEHGELFGGLLVRALGKMLDGTNGDFEALNQALRRRVLEPHAAR